MRIVEKKSFKMKIDYSTDIIELVSSYMYLDRYLEDDVQFLTKYQPAKKGMQDVEFLIVSFDCPNIEKIYNEIRMEDIRHATVFELVAFRKQMPNCYTKYNIGIVALGSGIIADDGYPHVLPNHTYSGGLRGSKLDEDRDSIKEKIQNEFVMTFRDSRLFNDDGKLSSSSLQLIGVDNCSGAYFLTVKD